MARQKMINLNQSHRDRRVETETPEVHFLKNGEVLIMEWMEV